MGLVSAPGTIAQYAYPQGVAFDGTGTGNSTIRKIDSACVVSTLSGTGSYGFTNGPVATAQFAAPYGVAVDGIGNVYVADSRSIS